MQELIDKVVTIVTTAGDVIGQVESIEDGIIKLHKPRLFYTVNDQQGNGQLALAPSISATATPFVSTAWVSVNGVVSVSYASDDATLAWQGSNKPEITSVSQTH
jgi:hypothetical protein